MCIVCIQDKVVLTGPGPPTTRSLHTKSKSFNDDIDVSVNYPIVYKESDCDYVNPLGATG